MKIKLIIFTFFLFSCSFSEKKENQNIINASKFGKIIKELHLAEASYEIINKTPKKNSTKKLEQQYGTIFNKHNISAEEFNKSLKFYSSRPDLLEKIYTEIITELKKEKTNLNHLNTN